MYQVRVNHRLILGNQFPQGIMAKQVNPAGIAQAVFMDDANRLIRKEFEIGMKPGLAQAKVYHLPGLLFVQRIKQIQEARERSEKHTS